MDSDDEIPPELVKAGEPMGPEEDTRIRVPITIVTGKFYPNLKWKPVLSIKHTIVMAYLLTEKL